MQPQIPINVDADTGVWDTDGLAMLYLPRHFFVHNHKAVEAALGAQAYAEVLYQPGYKSAHFWCTQESKTHRLAGIDVYRHYLKRLSQRGWGLFEFEVDDIASGRLRIALRHSAFVKHHQQFYMDKLPTDPCCYMYAGWLAGAADWVAEDMGIEGGFASYEHQCQIEAKPHAHCSFLVERR